MKVNYEELLEKSKANSIGANKKNELVSTIKVISKKSLSVMIIVALGVSLCACNKMSYTLPENDISDIPAQEYQISSSDYDFIYKDISSIKSEKISNARAQLIIAKINYCDKNGRILANDISTYKNIKRLNEDDLIGYYIILKKDESEKLLILLGYKGWDDYLIQHGYVDENGVPQIDMWEYSVYESMQKEVEGSYKK